MNNRERQKLYYRTHPDFRARQLHAVHARHKANAADPDYRRLVQLRKDMHRIRESYEARMAHAARLSERLVKLAKELLRVEARWHRKKA